MLSTQQELFEHQYKERQLDLSMKEMEVEQANLAVSISVAALIAGFSSAVLVGSLSIDIGNVHLKNFVFFVTLVCISCELYAILKGCLCMIRAPNLAYRGSTKTSVTKAVDQMVIERPAIFWAFVMGLLTFFLLIMGMLWVKLGVSGTIEGTKCGGQCLHSWWSAMVLSVMVGLIIIFFCHTVLRLITIEFEDDESVSEGPSGGLADYPKDFRYVPAGGARRENAGTVTSTNPLGPNPEPERRLPETVTKTIAEVIFPKMAMPHPTQSMFSMTVRPVNRPRLK